VTASHSSRRHSLPAAARAAAAAAAAVSSPVTYSMHGTPLSLWHTRRFATIVMFCAGMAYAV